MKTISLAQNRYFDIHSWHLFGILGQFVKVCICSNPLFPLLPRSNLYETLLKSKLYFSLIHYSVGKKVASEFEEIV